MSAAAHIPRWAIRAVCVCTLLCVPLWAGAESARFQTLLQQADSMRTSDVAEFGTLLGRLDDLVAEATPLQRQQLQFLHAYRLALAGDFTAAIDGLKRLFEETTDVTLKFRAGTFLANNFAATREFVEGLAYLDQALELLPQVPDHVVKQDGLLSAMVLFNQVGQYDLALHYADSVLAATSNSRTRCKAEFMRLEALFNLDQLPADDQQFTKGIDDCQAQGEVLVAGFIRGYLARKWATAGRIADAAALLRDHLAEVEVARYPRLTSEIHSLLAQYEFELGHIDVAEEYAQKAIAQSSGIAFSLPLVLAHKTLYDTAIERGDTAAALDHFRSYAEADKAYLDAIKARELAVQLAKHETLQKTQTIELLNKQNQVLQLQQKVSKQAAINTQLLLALVLVLLASISFWAYRTKRMQLALKRIAETDALTGVSNRGHFTHLANELLANAAKQGRSVSLIMFDLDLFKRINDRFGHASGDWVLSQVAQVCRMALGPKTILGRIGGEEFALLRSPCEMSEAQDLANELRQRIAAIDSRRNGAVFRISASFGVSCSGVSGHDLDRLLAHADHALYASKDKGRNWVSAYDEAAAEAHTAFAGHPNALT